MNNPLKGLSLTVFRQNMGLASWAVRPNSLWVANMRAFFVLASATITTKVFPLAGQILKGLFWEDFAEFRIERDIGQVQDINFGVEGIVVTDTSERMTLMGRETASN